MTNSQKAACLRSPLRERLSISQNLTPDARVELSVNHAVGVAIDTYTMTDLETKQQAVTTLEESAAIERSSARSDADRLIAGYRVA